ncbi:putative Oxidored-nitro domain-containing protein [Operophtera brumata]|uniref:Putative Oxidored-nitro domain-containing protein n=1 Tax=Operophtera brumata TaxID=104452 RepID=A0A0L7LA28_OPEBR|nr:putative Oxidored-nitro domain-containing protein [Operophtera brumata]
MSHFATSFIVVNLGCEMAFVIDQRLKAQSIPNDRSERVLTDLVTVLLHRKLLDELFLPQPVAQHAVIKQLLQDISSTSIMKLDDYSMSKLWDLMTMIFKWQLAVATNQNIFDITRRHLKGVATLMPQYFQENLIQQTIFRFESLSHKFTDDDYKCLSNTMVLWFSEYHTKISVLLRLGLQKKDGTFSLPATLDPKILQNLGENIYKYDSKKNPVDEYEQRSADTSEINCLLSTIEKLNLELNIELQLPIQFGNSGGNPNIKIIKLSRDTQFENIDTNIKSRGSTDLTFNPNIPKSTNEDLLDMMKDIC